MKTFIAFLICTFHVLHSQEVVKIESAKPELPGRIFKEIGLYEVSGGQLLASRMLCELSLAPIRLQVFSDGIDIRIKIEGKEDGYLEFQIYRDTGVYDESGENLLPGIQGFSDRGGVIRHLSLTQDQIVIVKHPSRSSDIEVTYAKRDE